MRFRPANIRVINRRASSSAVIGSVVQPEVLKAHQREPCSRYAARQGYSQCQNGARRARVRFAAPNSGAPLPAPRRSGQAQYATGGSGGNTLTVAGMGQKGKTVSSGGLTISLSYSY